MLFYHQCISETQRFTQQVGGKIKPFQSTIYNPNLRGDSLLVEVKPLQTLSKEAVKEIQEDIHTCISAYEQISSFTLKGNPEIKEAFIIKGGRLPKSSYVLCLSHRGKITVRVPVEETMDYDSFKVFLDEYTKVVAEFKEL